MAVSLVRLVPALVLAAGIVEPGFAQPAPGSVGRVKASSGVATIVRGSQSLPAVVGGVVQEGDVLRTGPGGQLSVTLRDNTRLSLAADTEVAVREFAFAPAEGHLTMLLRVAQGVLSYVSGRIAKLSPGTVRLETPTLVIGVRGTHALISVDAP